MLAMGTSGSMSGDGKRGASRATALILDSTNRSYGGLPQDFCLSRTILVRLRQAVLVGD